jgi:hypothetical protein
MTHALARAALAGAALAALLTSPALAAGTPATVSVRVVGLTGTTLLPQTQVTTTTTPVDPDGTPADSCTGTSAMGALEDATHGNVAALYDGPVLGYEIDGIEGETFPAFADSPDAYWSFWLNGTFAQNGACGQELNPGDEVVFFAQCDNTGTDCTSATAPDHYLTETAPPASANVGAPVSVTVGSVGTGSGSSEPLPGSVTVSAGSQSVTPNGQGVATFTFPSPGVYAITASAPDSVPSDSRTVCAHYDGDGACGTTPFTGGGEVIPPPPPGGPPLVATSIARITGLHSGQSFRFAHAPRLLQGSVTVGAAGLREVELRLRRHYRGRCEFLSAITGGFRPAGCGARIWVNLGSGASWSFLLASQLPPGNYELDVVPIVSSGALGHPQTVDFVVHSRRR